VITPAAGTLKVGPAYRYKVCKTLMREVGRIKLRFHFAFAHLYSETFLLQCSSNTLRILRETTRCFVKLASELERHGCCSPRTTGHGQGLA